MKQRANWLIPLTLLALMSLSFHLSARLTLLCPSTSLRYETPLTARQVQWAKAYAKENGTPFLTFWTESKTFVTFQNRGTEAAQILYDGDPDLAYGVTYRYGSAPGLAKENCAVSSALAWELWQSDQVVGMILEIDSKEYTVSGVFEGDDHRLFRWADSGFTAVEIPNTPKGEDSYRYALDLAVQSGLGRPAGILWGSGMADIGQFLCFAPLILAGCMLVLPYLARLRKLPTIVWYVLILGIVLALPWILELLPGWLVPTRWSDFGFYGRLWDTFRDRWHDLLMLSPTLLDARRKAIFLGLLFCSCGSMVLTREFKQNFFSK